MKEIFKNIEEIRREQKVKQTVIAEKLGVKQNAYSQYIHNMNDIPLGKLSRIADILEVSVIDIITYPIKYTPEKKECVKCNEKDETIRILHNYIKILEKKA